MLGECVAPEAVPAAVDASRRRLRRARLDLVHLHLNALPLERAEPLFDALERLRECLTSGGRTLARGALGWLWARSSTTLPIPGFRTVAQVRENVGALEHGALPDATMAEIETLVDRSGEEAVRER